MPESKVKKINHIALAVNSLSEAENLYVNVLGFEVKHREVIEDQGVKTSMLLSRQEPILIRRIQTGTLLCGEL